MLPGERRRARINNGVVATRSVWETRMKMDEIKGGIKVFNGDDDSNEDVEGIKLYGRLRRNQSAGGVVSERKKRRNWKPPEAVSNGALVKNPIQLKKSLSDSKVGISKEEEEEDDDIQIEGEMRSFDDKEIDLPVEKLNNVEEEKKMEPINEIPILMDVEKKQNLVLDLKKEDPKEKKIDQINEIPTLPEVVKKQNYVIDHKKKETKEKKIDQINEIPTLPEVVKKQNYVIDHKKKETKEKKIDQINEIPTLPEVVKKQNYVIDHKKKETIEVEEEIFETPTEIPKRMQNIVDLVMWREISKSAFVFGLGAFILLSSSCTKDLNFSLISAISYLGLVYLALNFIYKSIIKRGDVEFAEREGRCIIGEEEAIWALRFLLPYINEVLVKFRALFSGDPATTMKLAALLFVTARCGNSITISTLAKIVFFGIFTIPKVLSSFSVQLARYEKFWLGRFRDGWESCTHKKAVAAAVFTLIWNMSSTVARIWAVFMLVVAVQFYQQYEVDLINAEKQEEEFVAEQEGARADSKPELSPGNNNNNNNNNNNKNNRVQLQHRQRNGPKATAKAKKAT